MTNKGSRLSGLDGFLKALQTDSVPHAKGSLFDHLMRVAELLRSWDCDSEVAFAGGLHSTYGTKYFKTELKVAAKDSQIHERFGQRVAQLVQSYSTMDRNEFFYSLILKNRKDVSTVEIDLLHMLLANAIDHPGILLESASEFSASFSLLKPKAQAALRQVLESREAR